MKKGREIKRIKELLDQAEKNIREAKEILFNNLLLSAEEKVVSFAQETVEGVFDGETMVTSSGKRYPVPVNYASKSKLVCGDRLKLRITDDGSFIYKQIDLVSRKRITGFLKKAGDRFLIEHKGCSYGLLQAAVSYYKAQEGDKIAVLVPRESVANWAALENVIKSQKD